MKHLHKPNQKRRKSFKNKITELKDPGLTNDKILTQHR